MVVRVSSLMNGDDEGDEGERVGVCIPSPINCALEDTEPPVAE